MRQGSLTVVGTGLHFATQLTLGARAAIEQADRVVYVLDDAEGEAWLRTLNPAAESLRERLQGAGARLRLDAYGDMAEHIVTLLREGLRVCAVFEGHPGVFVCPAHQALQRARQEGFAAKLLPGITAADCLFADLELDPAPNGCQLFDATDLLLNRRRFDSSAELLLWQVGMVGNPYYRSYEPVGLPLLVEFLAEHYGPEHEVVLYEAAVRPGQEPVIERVPLARLPEARINERSLLYVPARPMESLHLETALQLARLAAPAAGRSL